VCATALAAIAATRFLASTLQRRIAVGALLAIAAIGFVQAVHQQWHQPSELASRNLVFQPENKYPRSWYAGFDYADVDLPVVPYGSVVQIPDVTVTGGDGESILPVPTDGHTDISTLTFPAPGPGKLVATNMYGGPYLIKVTGGRIVGRTPSNEVVIEVSAPAGQEAKVTFSTNHPAPVALGIAMTIAAFVISLLLVAWALLRALRERGVRLRHRRVAV
jgi:disulfide bond formation protein DsbB